MYQLSEALKISDRTLQNIEYHNLRFNTTRKNLFGITDFCDLSQLIKIPESLDNQVYKCRLVYDTQIHSIEFELYKIRQIKSLQLVENEQIEYQYKYIDRSFLDRLKQNCKADDILIVKGGKITDTSFSNIAFFDGESWFTPNTYLLNGTKRQLLLNQRLIKEIEIKFSDIQNFQKAMFINAMLDFENSPIVDCGDIN